LFPGIIVARLVSGRNKPYNRSEIVQQEVYEKSREGYPTHHGAPMTIRQPYNDPHITIRRIP